MTSLLKKTVVALSITLMASFIVAPFFDAKGSALVESSALQVGQEFSWHYENESDAMTQNVVVILTMPAKPTTLTVPANTHISDDGRTAHMNVKVLPGESITFTNQVTEGDPAGEYRIDIFIGDDFLKTHYFDVE